jgi:hypothetical protein
MFGPGRYAGKSMKEKAGSAIEAGDHGIQHFERVEIDRVACIVS